GPWTRSGATVVGTRHAFARRCSPVLSCRAPAIPSDRRPLTPTLSRWEREQLVRRLSPARAAVLPSTLGRRARVAVPTFSPGATHARSLHSRRPAHAHRPPQ